MTKPLVPHPPSWTYRRAAIDSVVEICTVRGTDVGLPPHFHDEDQIVFVISGRRRFLIEGNVVDLRPGRSYLVRAGVVHRSLAEPGGVNCLNVYVEPATATSEMIDEIRWWSEQGGLGLLDPVVVARRYPLEQSGVCNISLGRESVADAAVRSGMSREGFTRAFTRNRGMPPHGYRIASKLNQARRLLRSGEDIASAAAEAGFVDQSHLGRWFRRVFGTTPGRYRDGCRSQTYQTSERPAG